MCIAWLKKMLCTKDEGYNIPAPSPLDDIGYSEIYTVLKAEFPDAQLLFADNNYKTTTKTEMMRFLRDDVIDSNTYISEYYDCDDFSFALMGSISNQEWGSLPFGILWTKVPGGAHAVNCFIDKARTVWVIEPQNDSIFRLPSDWEPYLVII